jgi:DNA-directed RNA polymerase subunit M/transcription elongation factor TFIIS
MFFYGFDKKKVRADVREQYQNVLSADLEQALYEKVITLDGDATKNYIFALQQFSLCDSELEIDALIKGGEFSWNHPSLKEDILTINEMRDYIQKPLEVEEGVITCKKCGSRRVFSYQKQTRGCDESSTTFAQCAKCGKKWTYSG